jgi:hypothetical protein
MRAELVLAWCAALAAGGCARPKTEQPARLLQALPEIRSDQLHAPEAFAVIADREQRSQALFLEMSRVLLHPRCSNCHPDGDEPYQGMNGMLHDPPVTRGAVDMGVVGMQCSNCHQNQNVELSRVPGAPGWHLAPRSTAWVGKTPRAVCEQIKDPERNGGKSLAELVEHNASDPLTGWGWRPGAGREPVPGTQQQFGAITRAWIDTGAACPIEEARP